jgi:hypothetical protein
MAMRAEFGAGRLAYAAAPTLAGLVSSRASRVVRG